MPSAKRKPLKTTRTEAEVSRQVVEAAKMLGIELRRRNVGAFANPKGQMVRCGQPGDADYEAVLPDGRALRCEIKREDFDPLKLKREKKAHFDRQLAELQRINASNGVAFWVADSEEFLTILRHVLAGARIVEPGYGRPEIIYPETESKP
jgi:hypothetical protein